MPVPRSGVRLPSVRFAIEDDCPGITGTTRTLRLPATPPASTSYSFVMDGTTVAPGLRSAVGPTRRHWAWMLVHAAIRYAANCRWRWQYLPSSRTNPLAVTLMLARRPEEPAGTRQIAPSDPATGWTTAVASSMKNFRGSVAWLTVRCLRFKAPRLSRHDARLASDCAATLCRVGFAPTGFALKSFNAVFSSHRILLSRAYLAQCPFFEKCT